MKSDQCKTMSLSKKTADVCIVFLSLILLGIHAADKNEQMYVGISGYEFSDSLQKSYTNIGSPAYCASACLPSNCSSFTYNNDTKECRIHTRKFGSSVGATPVPTSIYYEVAHEEAVDNAATRCEDFSQGIVNGVYQVHPSPGPSRQYYCYRAGDDRLWNVIQYRYDGSLGFNRTWDDYKNGFGSLMQEFWLGNDEINRLTVEQDTMLRIEMEDYSNIKTYAQYNTFYIDDEEGKYKLTIGDYTGTAGDAFIDHHNGKYFTTRDRDNDNNPFTNCAETDSAGYWYDECRDNNLNGIYASPSGTCMFWPNYETFPFITPLKVSRMMVRKK